MTEPEPSPLPDVSALVLSDLHLELPPPAVITDADIDERLRFVAEEQLGAPPRDEGETVQPDDAVLAEIVVALEGDETPTAAYSGEWVRRGSGPLTFLRPLVEGAKVGDTVSGDATIPADFPDEELAGKAASFALRVLGARPSVIPDLENKKTLAALGLGDSAAAVRAVVRSELEDEAHRAFRTAVREDLIDTLFEHVEVACADDEIDAALAAAWEAEELPHLEEEGVDVESMEAARALFIDDIRVRAAYARASCLSRVLEAIAVRDDIDLEASRAGALAHLALTFSEDPKVLDDESREDPGLAAALFDTALELAVFSHLLAHITIDAPERCPAAADLL